MTCESPRDDAEPRAGIAIFVRRELVRPHPGANSLLPLEMIDAETIRKGEVPCRHRLIDPVDLPGGSDSSIDVKHHLAAPLNVGDGFAEGGEPIGRCDRYSNHA